MDKLNNITLSTLQIYPVNLPFNRMVKRGFDVCFSVVFMILFFPIVFLIIGTIIKCSSKGPVLFKQKRTGRDGKEFVCYKFRSMKLNAQADIKQATYQDERITNFGKFMRKSNIDEIPQFWNVLIGDMSIVGPRPHMLKHTEEYSSKINNYMDRHLVKPGITGYAQVSGFRGEIRTPEQLSGRIQHDLWYIENWSAWLDLKIILLTICNIFKGEENAY